MSNERWRPIPGFPHYEVSDAGRVRRLRSVITGRDGVARTFHGGVLQPQPWKGYLSVTLSVAGVHSHQSIQFLVMAAFVGPRPRGLRINHQDGVKTNNRLRNLEYATASEDRAHAYRLGLVRPPRQTRPTHCARGHAFASGYYTDRSTGQRRCAACHRERVRSYQRLATQVRHVRARIAAVLDGRRPCNGATW